MATRKKILSGILALFLATAIGGCGMTESPPASDSPPAPQIMLTQPQPETVSESTAPVEETEAPTVPAATEVKAHEQAKEETKPVKPSAAAAPGTNPTAPAETEPPEATPPKPAPPETQPPAATQPPAPPATEPAPTKPAAPPATEPVPTEPPATEPEETAPPSMLPETQPTEPEKQEVNTTAIEASANGYARSLGFVIDTSLGQGNSGYYPPDYRVLTATEDGYGPAASMVYATMRQLNSRFSDTPSDVLVEGAYGLARANCKVVFSHTDELGDWYYIYVFYG